MDPIKYIFEKPALPGQIARWKMIVTEYDIQYTMQKAIKGSVLADVYDRPSVSNGILTTSAQPIAVVIKRCRTHRDFVITLVL